MGDWLGGNGGIITQEGSDLDGLKLNVDSAVAVLRRKLIIEKEEGDRAYL